MFRIGEFARISGVSPKMLRHYEQLGLLRPAHVEAGSRYRYYTLEQLRQVEQIRTLAEAGLMLRQIETILNQRLSNQAFEDLLYARRSELEEKLQQLQTQLQNLDNRIRTLKEQEMQMGMYEITLKSAEGYSKPSLPEDGKMFTIPLPPTHDPALSDVIFKIDRETQPEALACTIHRGDMSQVGAAYRALHEWIEANGYQVSAPPREIQIDTIDSVIELQVPIRKVRRQA